MNKFILIGLAVLFSTSSIAKPIDDEWDIDSEPEFYIYSCEGNVLTESNSIKNYKLILSFPIYNEMKDDMDERMEKYGFIENTYSTEVRVQLTVTTNGVEVVNDDVFDLIEMNISNDDKHDISTRDSSAVKGVSMGFAIDNPPNSSYLYINLNEKTAPARFTKATCGLVRAG